MMILELLRTVVNARDPLAYLYLLEINLVQMGRKGIQIAYRQGCTNDNVYSPMVW